MRENSGRRRMAHPGQRRGCKFGKLGHNPRTTEKDGDVIYVHISDWIISFLAAVVL